MLRIFLLILVIITTIDAKYEKVKIGNIDSFYSDKISDNELYQMILEIKDEFDNKIGVTVFDYDEDVGKPIDIIYVPKSRQKREYEKALNSLESQKMKIDDLKDKLLQNKEIIEEDVKILEQQNQDINNRISKLNSYITKLNSRKDLSKNEYNEAKEYIDTEQRRINTQTRRFNQDNRQYKSKLIKYKQSISFYNNAINKYNRFQRKLEIMARSIKEIKGVAKGYTQTTVKKFHENGKTYTQKETLSYMEKIEIYGFEDLKELKAILAHELGHLVGLGHINKEGALMNPILQQNQVKNFSLTKYDVKEFRKIFD
jgi:chaperonin cofactor prefoldin